MTSNWLRSIRCAATAILDALTSDTMVGGTTAVIVGSLPAEGAPAGGKAGPEVGFGVGGITAAPASVGATDDESTAARGEAVVRSE